MSNKESCLVFTDKDIATIEAMHDLLLDCGKAINDRALRESRGLTGRMYKAMKYSSDSYSEITGTEIDKMGEHYGE